MNTYNLTSKFNLAAHSFKNGDTETSDTIIKSLVPYEILSMLEVLHVRYGYSLYEAIEIIRSALK